MISLPQNTENPNNPDVQQNNNNRNDEVNTGIPTRAKINNQGDQKSPGDKFKDFIWKAIVILTDDSKSWGTKFSSILSLLVLLL